MENVETAVSPEATQEANTQKMRTRLYWKLDLNLFARIWFPSSKDGVDDKNFKQIKALVCILRNITAKNNTLPVTYEVIANEAGVSQDMVVRIMHRLRKKDFLQRRRNGLYVVNPYFLMRGRDYICLNALYRSYCAVKDENLQRKQNKQDKPGEQSRNIEQNKQGEPEEQNKQEMPNTSDTAADSPSQTKEEKAEAVQRRKPPAEEYSTRSFWKFDLFRFSRIWYNGRSKKGADRPVKQDFKQLTVLAYILLHIISTDNTLRVTYQEISDDTGVSKDVVLHIMRRLQKRDFLQKKRNGLYVVNPFYLMMGRDDERFSGLYQSYNAVRCKNNAKKEIEEQRRLEKDPDRSKSSSSAKRGRKRKNSTISPEIIIDAPSANDGLLYWDNINVYELDELYGISGEAEEDAMTIEEMEQVDESIMELVRAGYGFGALDFLAQLAEAENAEIEARMAAEQNDTSEG